MADVLAQTVTLHQLYVKGSMVIVRGSVFEISAKLLAKSLKPGLLY